MNPKGGPGAQKSELMDLNSKVYISYQQLKFSIVLVFMRVHGQLTPEVGACTKQPYTCNNHCWLL